MYGKETMEVDVPLADIIEAGTAALMVIMALVFVQYAIINWNTGYSWLPYVAGPLGSAVFMLSLIIVLLAKNYRLVIIEILTYSILTLIAYVINYADSTVIDYEYTSLFMVFSLLGALALERLRGSEPLDSFHLFLVEVLNLGWFVVSFLLAFKLGSAYPFIITTIGFLSSLINLLLVIVIFMESSKHAYILTGIAFVFFLIYCVGAGIVGPDVTAWMLRAPVLGSYIALLWTAHESGWE